MNSVALISLGCAKNLVNSEQMLALIARAGFAVVTEPGGADIAVVNTCGFIESAKREAIETILSLGALKKAGELKHIIVAGCLAERYKDEISRDLPEVDAILGTGAYGDIAHVVESVLSGEAPKRPPAAPPENTDDDMPRLVSTPRAWAYLKIAEGCDNRCAYCVIPRIRGRYRSRAFESIVAEAETLVENGARELILIAQDTTRYGVDRYNKRRLRELLARLSEIRDLRWLRVHYMYPDEIDDELLGEFAANPKVLPYFDIPIQHIDDGVLSLMRRRGSGDDIRALIAKIRGTVTGAVIRTSLITGLPGESEAAFEALCLFLRESRIERPGIFVFSPEEGTDAFDMQRPDEDTARRRAELLASVQSENLDAFNLSRIGSRVEVLIEGRADWPATNVNGAAGGQEANWFAARSYAESPDIDGYIRVEGRGLKIGGFYEIEINRAEDGEVYGRITGGNK